MILCYSSYHKQWHSSHYAVTHKVLLFPSYENIFLSINFNICFGISKEPSQRDSSFKYPQHMFWLINKKNLL